MEHLSNSEKEQRYVTLPASLLKALYALQKEPTAYEWGGGIDFEVRKGEPVIERILAYFGEKNLIPAKIIEKYKGDVEVLFHTHPRQRKVQPSPEDIQSFLISSSQVEFIVASEEIAVFEKTTQHRKLMEKIGRFMVPIHYDPDLFMPEIIDKLDKAGINSYVYHKTEEAPVFDINIIKKDEGI